MFKQIPRLQEMWDGDDMGLTRSKQLPPWEQWFAWHPVKDVNGRWHWLSKVYRRYSWVKSDTFNKGYDYGTLFDVIKDS